MELINATNMVAGCTLGVEPSGRELLIVVVKGTFRIPRESGARIVLHEEQVALVMSDVFHGEPGLSAPKYEADFVPRKPRCDVLLNGSAYAPEGRPTTRVVAGLQIGSWSKSFAVLGDRVWFTAGGVRVSDPEPFIAMPITYDRAFGGTDSRHEDPAEHAAFMPNPSGCGFHKHLAVNWLDGTALPNTESVGEPIEQPDGFYQPMSFGAVGRHWEPRCRHAGTYDQDWLDNVFPFLPADFSECYYQSAPPDQQLPKFAGEQPVTLLNVTPDGRRDFLLPFFEAPLNVFPRGGGREDHTAQLDTIQIEPDLERITMVWRVARPLKKNIFEIGQVLVGRRGSQWWRQRERLNFPISVVMERTRS